MICPLGGQGVNPSGWLTLLSPCMMDWGPLPQPGPVRASPSSHGAAHEVIVLHSPQDSAALLSSGTGGFCGGCCSQLNQKEITCSHLEFGKSDGTLVTWLILFLLGWESMKVAHLHFSLWSHHTSHAWWQCCAVRQKVPIPLGFLTFNGSCWKKISLKSQI